MNASPKLKTEPDAGLIDKAHKAVLVQNREAAFDLVPYMNAIELMEGLPPDYRIDDRIRLAIDTALGLGQSERPLLCSRALHAACPSGQSASDPKLQRGWHCLLGGVAVNAGNIAESVLHLGLAYDIAARHKDHAGLASTWMSLAALASGSGQYEDAVSYATVALEQLKRCDPKDRIAIGAYVNRGNAAFRLGRLSDASGDFSRACAICCGRTGLWYLSAQVCALCALADVLIVQGEVAIAAITLDSAAGLHAENHGVPTALLNTGRVRGQLLVASGDQERGLRVLEDVLADANRLCGEAAGDLEVLDCLYALERTHRSVGHLETADSYLTQIAVHLQSNAKRTLFAAASDSAFPVGKQAVAAMRELDDFIDARKRRGDAAASSAMSEAASSLQQLIALASSASAVEEVTGEHGIRVAALCREVATNMGLGDEVSRVAEYAGLVHDAGKAGVPTAVLAKREPLSTHEETLYRDHPDYGSQIVHTSLLPARARIAEAVRLHHHPFDGVGVQDGPRGDAIPIESRILAACDRFDALLTGRPRQAAVGVQESLREVFRASGRDFDPRVVAVLVDVVRTLHREHTDLVGFLARDAEKYDYTAARRKVQRAADER